MCVVLIIRNKLGIEERNNVKHLDESEKRLQNKEYVNELIENGYDVLEKYR